MQIADIWSCGVMLYVMVSIEFSWIHNACLYFWKGLLLCFRPFQYQQKLMAQMVGAYPFERPEDKNDTQKLQKMIQVKPLLQPPFPASPCPKFMMAGLPSNC